jgi:cob(I)alamin adenosyltransferase
MTADDAMHRVEELLTHVWMVRTFLKHSEEAEEDDELMEVVRDLYDYTLALGAPWNEKNAAEYLKQARKKLAKLRAATARFAELQPQISTHTNFQMANRSLAAAVREIGEILDSSA